MKSVFKKMLNDFLVYHNNSYCHSKAYPCYFNKRSSKDGH